MSSARINLNPRPFARSATGEIGTIGLPLVYCVGCWRPLHRELVSRVASAVAQGKMNQDTVRCFRSDCRVLGGVDLDFLLAMAEIIEAQNPARHALGRGRPVKLKRCAACKEWGTSRWHWCHTRGGRKCGATGARIPAR